jgi:RND family efflux transporter MFP subunit
MKTLHLAIIPAIAFATSCGHKPEPVADRPAVKVQTLEAQVQRTPNIVEVVGTVRAKYFATISAKVLATIREIPVAAGDSIGAGQTLATLDDRELRAEFNRAKADYDRYKTLLDEQAVTRAEFEAVESRYRIAEAALSNTQITAPFNALVTGKSCEVGDMAAPGKTLFTLEQPTEFRLEAEVPERYAAVVAPGKVMSVVIDATNEKCEAKVDEVAPAANPATRSVLVKIALQCRQTLHTGQFGRAQLLVGERFAIFVPTEAVHERGQLTYVFVAGDGRAQMRLVKTGKIYLGAYEILSGLQTGDRIITSAAKELTDGQPVSF